MKSLYRFIWRPWAVAPLFSWVLKRIFKTLFHLCWIDVVPTPQAASDQDDEFDMFAQSRKSTFDEVRER